VDEGNAAFEQKRHLEAYAPAHYDDLGTLDHQVISIASRAPHRFADILRGLEILPQSTQRFQ
jgi:hypothetical protein